jgi:hypothetical protein
MSSVGREKDARTPSTVIALNDWECQGVRFRPNVAQTHMTRFVREAADGNAAQYMWEVSCS